MSLKQQIAAQRAAKRAEQARRAAKVQPHRHTGASVNPAAMLVAMSGATYLDAADIDQQAKPVEESAERICQGRGEREDWRHLFDAINITEQIGRASKRILPVWAEWLESVQDTVVQIADRQRETGSRALYANERATITRLAQVWREVLEQCSKRQYFAATEAAERKVRAALSASPAAVKVIDLGDERVRRA